MALAAVARDRDPRPGTVGRGQVLLGDHTQPRQRPRSGRLDDDVSRGHQALEGVDARPGGQVEGHAGLPRVHQVEERRRPEAGTVGPVGRFDLDHARPGQGEQVPAQGSGPQRREIDHGGGPTGEGPGAAVRGDPHGEPGERGGGRGHGPGRGGQDGHRQAEQHGPLLELLGASGGRRRHQRGPRVGGRLVELEPGGHRGHVVGPGQGHGQPSVHGGHQPAGAAATGGALAVQAGDRGPLAEQGEGLGGGSARPRREGRAQRAEPVHQRCGRPERGPPGPPGERHGAAGGPRGDPFIHGAMVARRPRTEPGTAREEG